MNGPDWFEELQRQYVPDAPRFAPPWRRVIAWPATLLIAALLTTAAIGIKWLFLLIPWPPALVEPAWFILAIPGFIVAFLFHLFAGSSIAQCSLKLGTRCGGYPHALTMERLSLAAVIVSALAAATVIIVAITSPVNIDVSGWYAVSFGASWVVARSHYKVAHFAAEPWHEFDRTIELRELDERNRANT